MLIDVIYCALTVVGALAGIALAFWAIRETINDAE